MDKVLYRKDGRIGRITLNRPAVRNAIDGDLPAALSAAVAQADADPGVHVMVLAGNGPAFCAGYDLAYCTENTGPDRLSQDMPWDPVRDYSLMWANTQHFMSLWRAAKPVICRVHGYALAGGSDIALCADLTVMAENARIGYPAARIWGCPTTAMWVYRIGAEKAKRMLFTGDTVSGREAEEMGLVLKAVAEDRLDAEIEALAERMASVPVNQLAMQKLVVNQAVEATGLMGTQRLATVFDGIARHSPEGVNFKARVDSAGWKQAVRDRDQGTFDWTANRPIEPPESAD